MPTVADLNKLDSLAQVGNHPVRRLHGRRTAGEARTRVHFLTIDLGVAMAACRVSSWSIRPGTAIANPEQFVSASLPPAGVTAIYLDSRRTAAMSANGGFLAAFDHDRDFSRRAISTHRHNTNANIKARRDSALIVSSGGRDTLIRIRPAAAGLSVISAATRS